MRPAVPDVQRVPDTLIPHVRTQTTVIVEKGILVADDQDDIQIPEVV
jgi:hypothetical protein